MARTNAIPNAIPPRDVSGTRKRSRNFTASLTLLGMALLAALYSNSSARSGYFHRAVLGALVALALALWVAWRFVPRLALAIDWRWSPFPARTRLTREGWVSVCALVVVGATAINTNNNLLYMIFAALTATLVLSVALAAINLRSLALSVRVPAECFVREGFPMKITLENGGRVLPRFSLGIRPSERTAFRFSRSYFPIVRPGERVSVTLETACSRRGRHRIGTLHIESRYPFGFFLKGGPFPVPGDCIAFPEIRRIDLPGGSSPDLLGSSEQFRKGEGTDLYMIRDYQTTDSARRVDWKASAKTASLKTREFTREETRRVVLLFDRYGRDGEDDRFEELVARAASLAVALAGDGGRGVEVALVSDERASAFASSDPDLRSILRYLALVRMSPQAPPPHNPHGGETLRLSLRPGR